MLTMVLIKNSPPPKHYYKNVTTRCDGPCKNYRAKYTGYLQGHKRCTTCETFIVWEGVFCPCCGHKLKTKRKGKKDDMPRISMEDI